MTPPKYDVRSEQPTDVKAEVMRVWADNLPVEGSVEDKFRWLYTEPEDPPQTVFTLTADGEVVGTAGVLHRRFRIAGQDTRAAILADLAVDESHRSLLPALRLVKAAKKHALSTYDLAYGFPNANAWGVFKRARYKELGQTVRYARVLRHAQYASRAAEDERVPAVVARALRNDIVARVAGRVADVGRLAKDIDKGARALARYKLALVDAADERFDDLWQRARGEYAIAAERTASFLNWRYTGANACRIATLSDRRSGELCAFALFQIVDGVAHLRDLFGHWDSLGPLFDLLLPRLYGAGATSASFRYLGGERMVSLLTEHGFQARESGRTIAVAVGAGMGQLSEVIESSDNWHMTDLDEDV